MSKADKIQKTALSKAESADLSRASGFYLVTGADTVAGNGDQPAYWDGKSWWLIGWESRVNSAAIRVVRPAH